MDKFLNRRKKKSTIMIIVLAALVCAGITTSAYATTQSELQKKINSAQKQADANNAASEDLSEDISKLETEISTTETEINNLTDEVVSAHNAVEEASAKLQQKKQELEEGNKNLAQRLRNIYKGGSVGFFDVILSSENISELFSNLEMVKYVFDNDKQVVENLKTNYAAIEKEQKELAEKESTLKAKQEELAQKQAELGKTRQTLASKKNSIDEETESLYDQIEDWEAESARIEAAINNAKAKGNGYSGGSSSGGTTVNPDVSTSGFGWPVPGYTTLSSTYGYRKQVFGEGDFHSGIDIPAPTGTSVVASKAGKVIYSGWQTGSGNIVIIDHGNNLATAYCHNSALCVSVGQTVSQGQVIAKVGMTGWATGPHCHFEVRINGKAVDPRKYV